MKPPKKPCLSKGQQLLLGYFTKRHGTTNRASASTSEIPVDSSTWQAATIDIEEEIVPPTPVDQIQTSSKGLTPAPVQEVPLRISAPLRHNRSFAEAATREKLSHGVKFTALSVKRKRSPDVISVTTKQGDHQEEAHYNSAHWVTADVIREGCHLPLEDEKENAQQNGSHASGQTLPLPSSSLLVSSVATIPKDSMVASFSPEYASHEISFLDDLDWDANNFGLENHCELQEKKALREFRRVKAVVASTCRKPGGELHLSLRALDDSQEQLTCTLRGAWRDQEVKPGDIAYLHANFIGSEAVVDSEDGYLVLHPDVLVSSTTLMSSLFCARKSLLATHFRHTEEGNLEMLLGTISHELFQKAISDKAKGKAVGAILESLLQRSDLLHKMYALGLCEKEIRKQLWQLVPHISLWIERHLAGSREKMPRSDIFVSAVRDIEENHWCPRLGLKGKVDASVEVTIHGRSKLLPLELKTGKHSFSHEHKGQVMLYSLMMSERHGEHAEDGLLLYLRDSVEMQRVVSGPHERRALLQRRNDLAQHLLPGKELPPPIDSPRFCPKCPHATVCSIYERKSASIQDFTNRKPESSFVAKSLAHLSKTHTDYFLHWCHLLDIELAHGASDFQDRFWVEKSATRESKGSCLSNMALVSCNWHSPDKMSPGNSFPHIFRRRTKCSMESSGRALEFVGLNVGDRLVVSEEESTTRIAIATGTLTTLTKTGVTLLLDRDLTNEAGWQERAFRLDRSFSSASFIIGYSNLGRLMADDPVADRLRILLVNQGPSRFSQTLPRETALACRSALKPLNNCQRRAVLRFLMAQDYMLLKGMPGTGKTTTLAALIQALVLLRKRVLLTSYTHSGLDSVLLKLKLLGVPFLRLGAQDKINQAIREFSADFQTKDLRTTQELDYFYQSQMVVACTCLGVGASCLRRLHFDVCLVDEASQAPQPSCLGPLFLADKFLLVGDPEQLPPVVQSKQARDLGMDVSLFARLEREDNTLVLPVQYRMNRCA